jgi:hypothetical protein
MPGFDVTCLLGGELAFLGPESPVDRSALREARRKWVKGRSTMNKAELEKAVGR